MVIGLEKLGYKMVGEQIFYQNSYLGTINSRGVLELMEDSESNSHAAKIRQAYSVGVVVKAMQMTGIVIKSQEAGVNGGIKLSAGVRGL